MLYIELISIHTIELDALDSIIYRLSNWVLSVWYSPISCVKFDWKTE